MPHMQKLKKQTNKKKKPFHCKILTAFRISSFKLPIYNSFNLWLTMTGFLMLITHTEKVLHREKSLSFKLFSNVT
jgi:hypothetical protein